jgi:hypothetical protein
VSEDAQCEVDAFERSANGGAPPMNHGTCRFRVRQLDHAARSAVPELTTTEPRNVGDQPRSEQP